MTYVTFDPASWDLAKVEIPDTSSKSLFSLGSFMDHVFSSEGNLYMIPSCSGAHSAFLKEVNLLPDLIA